MYPSPTISVAPDMNHFTVVACQVGSWVAPHNPGLYTRTQMAENGSMGSLILINTTRKTVRESYHMESFQLTILINP